MRFNFGVFYQKKLKTYINYDKNYDKRLATLLAFFGLHFLLVLFVENLSKDFVLNSAKKRKYKKDFALLCALIFALYKDFAH